MFAVITARCTFQALTLDIAKALPQLVVVKSGAIIIFGQIAQEDE